jgi:hypothetical protein
VTKFPEKSRIQANYRRIKPSDWGIGVTVCIAAGCDEYQDVIPKVVLASDKILSFGITSTDRLKARGFGNNWAMMFAGDDVTFVDQVIDQSWRKIPSGASNDVCIIE